MRRLTEEWLRRHRSDSRETKPTFKTQRDEALNRECRLICWDELAGTESMNDADARDGKL